MEASKIPTDPVIYAVEDGHTFHYQEQEQEQDALESTWSTSSSVQNTPTLQRKNSQRRLRIPTEDHQLFLADLNEDILPYIKKCRQLNNDSSDDENEFPVHAANDCTKNQCQRQSIASTSSSSKHRVPQTYNGYNNTAKPDGSWTGASSQFPCSSKFQQYNNNNNDVSISMNSAAVLPSDEPIRRSRPAVKAYNSPKKSPSALKGDNCTIA